MDKAKRIEKIAKLVESFRSNESNYIKSGSKYNETEVRTDFINEFFIALGWDVLNKKSLSKPTREVVAEANLKDKENVHRPDYEFRIDSIKKFYVEAKKPSVDITKESKPAYQTRRYGWNAKLPISLVTNFRDLIIYDCTEIPREDQDPHFGRLRKYHYTEFVDKFDEIYDLISFPAVLEGSIESNFNELEENAIETFDKHFLRQIENWRIILAKDLLSNNDLSEAQINEYIQIFINRLIFLRTCEDRDLEPYGRLQSLNDPEAFKQLMKLFKNADQVYDSGLFQMLSSEASFKVSNEVIVKIVKDLYLPNSPYSFAVVEPEILGEIYEEFISKEITISDESFSIEDKPEVKESNGVYTTPKYIVSYILSQTLQKDLDTGIKESYSVADIACGSGIFLLNAYDLLLRYYLERAISQKDIKDLVKDSAGEYRLNIRKKQKILLDHIHGVDIDPHAVEVTKFSLYLKIIEDVAPGEVQEMVDEGHRVLPKLEENIQIGNSLVDKKFLDYKKIEDISLENIQKLKLYDFTKTFDTIIGNPPYIKIQKMKKYSPLEVSYFQSQESPYSTSKSHSFDKYMLFVERAIGLLSKGGGIGFIIPNKFMKIKSGEALRKVISDRNILAQLIDFNDLQVFAKKATTYTCITVLRDETSHIEFEKVQDLKKWRRSQGKNMTTFPLSEIDSKPWLFGAASEHFRSSSKLKLKDVAEIFVGLQTSADDIYIFQPESQDSDSVTFLNELSKPITIEREITKDAILDQSMHYFEKLVPNKKILFPYKKVDEKYVLLEEDELINQFPLAYKYLQGHKERLEKRHFSNKTPVWYQFGRSQSLQKNDHEKLIMKNPANHACVQLDKNQLYFTGGGNGPYYGIRSISSDYSNLVLSAILNSEIFDQWVKARSSIFSGGYYSFSKQFIEDFPIFISTKENAIKVQRMETIWDEIYTLNLKDDRHLSREQKKDLLQKKTYLKEQSEQIIKDLYNNLAEE